MHRVVAVFLLAPLALSADESIQLIKNLRSCSLITAPDARLKCYDSHFHQPAVSATQSPAELSLNQADAAIPKNEKSLYHEKTAKAVIGEKYLNQKPKDEGQKERISFTLIKTDQDSKGRWRFYFKNGQIWRQLEKRYLKISDLPVTASISEGFLGSHNLRIGESKRSIKVKRLE